MGYASISDVDFILGQALTSARPDTTNEKIKLINVGQVRNLNAVNDDVVNQYISFADNTIDGTLFHQYYTPFKKCANGQWLLDEDINPSGIEPPSVSGDDAETVTIKTGKKIVLDDACNLVPGDQVLIHDDITGQEENVIVDNLVDENIFNATEDLEGTFLAENNVRVMRKQYSPTLNQISARLAASYIYDKFFSAQASPNMSDYGQAMRNVAMGQLNDVLNGKIIIKCGRRKGDHVGNPWLDSAYSHRMPVDGYHASDRNASKLG